MIQPMSLSGKAPAGEPSLLQFKDIYYILLERAWIIALFVILAGIGVTAFLLKSPKLYSSTVLIEVEQKEQKVVTFQEVSQDNLGSKDAMGTIINILQSNAVAERVVIKNLLAKNEAFLRPLGLDSFTNLTLARIIKSRTEVEDRRGTRLIDITVDHEDPAIAQKLAGSLIYEALRLRVEQRADAASVATNFLREEAEKLKKKLSESENALQAYKEKYGTVSLEERQDTVTQKLKELNQNLTQVKAERIQMESQMNEAEKNKGDAQSLQSLASGMNDPASLDIRKKISELEAVIGNLEQRYKEKHPKMIQARSQLSELNESLRRLVSPERLKAAYDAALAKEKSFEEALRQQEDEALQLNRKAIDYNVIAREVETDRNMFESTMKRLRETDLAKGLETTDVRIIEAPTLPGSPSKPRKSLIVAIALVGGLLVGVSAAFGLYYLDDTFKTVDQVEAVLELPVLGALPMGQVESRGREDAHDEIFVEKHPEAPLTESFRSLRAALGLLGREETRKTFLFTSAVPEEGKSFVCANLAVMLAHQGLKTLLIDADMRKPRLSQVFNLSKHESGLGTWLTSGGELGKLVIKAKQNNLWILPSGPRVPNPAELLSGPAFAEVIREASQSFDRVVVDTAPIHAVSDTLMLIPFLQSVCLVVRAGKTPRNSVLRALEMIRRCEVRPVGVIVNRLPRNRGMGYYYYYTHYEGDEVYGSNSGEKKKSLGSLLARVRPGK